VTVEGDCSDDDAARLRTLFDELLKEDLPAVVLDLSRVGTLGPNGVHAVLEGQRAAADIDLPMVAVLDMAATFDSPEWPQLASLQDSIDTYPTVERALAALEG
jgi:hypothetical protein